MPEFDQEYLKPLLQIIAIDIMLSGDNGVVIALACRSLPPEQRRRGIILGAGAAILLRIIFAIFIVYLLGVPGLKIIGALLLFWIAYKLMLPEEGGHAHELEVGGGASTTGAPAAARVGTGTLGKAVRTIVIADFVMSLDNVVAIGAAAKGNVWLIVFGLLVSIPLILYGSTLILKSFDRFPWLVALGSGLLGYVAGEMLVHDPLVLADPGSTETSFFNNVPFFEQVYGLLGALGVVLAGTWGARRMKRRVERPLVDLAPRQEPPSA